MGSSVGSWGGAGRVGSGDVLDVISSFAYSCLCNYLSKYIWSIGFISNSFAIIVV
jgi:hypothetical protein